MDMFWIKYLSFPLHPSISLSLSRPRHRLILEGKGLIEVFMPIIELYFFYFLLSLFVHSQPSWRYKSGWSASASVSLCTVCQLSCSKTCIKWFICFWNRQTVNIRQILARTEFRERSHIIKELDLHKTVPLTFSTKRLSLSCQWNPSEMYSQQACARVWKRKWGVFLAGYKQRAE